MRRNEVTAVPSLHAGIQTTNLHTPTEDPTMLQKLDDLLSSHFEEFLEIDAESLSHVWRDAVAPFLAEIGASLDPTLAGAFLAGGLAMVAGARLAMLGAIVLLGAHIAVAQGVTAEIPVWVMPTAAALLLLGIAQGLLTLIAGEQTAGTLLATSLVVVILFIIWRGPMKGLRLVLLLIQRIGGR